MSGYAEKQGIEALLSLLLQKVRAVCPRPVFSAALLLRARARTWGSLLPHPACGWGLCASSCGAKSP